MYIKDIYQNINVIILDNYTRYINWKDESFHMSANARCSDYWIFLCYITLIQERDFLRWPSELQLTPPCPETINLRSFTCAFIEISRSSLGPENEKNYRISLARFVRSISSNISNKRRKAFRRGELGVLIISDKTVPFAYRSRGNMSVFITLLSSSPPINYLLHENEGNFSINWKWLITAVWNIWRFTKYLRASEDCMKNTRFSLNEFLNKKYLWIVTLYKFE